MTSYIFPHGSQQLSWCNLWIKEKHICGCLWLSSMPHCTITLCSGVQAPSTSQGYCENHTPYLLGIWVQTSDCLHSRLLGLKCGVTTDFRRSRPSKETCAWGGKALECIFSHWPRLTAGLAVPRLPCIGQSIGLN